MIALLSLALAGPLAADGARACVVVDQRVACWGGYDGQLAWLEGAPEAKGLAISDGVSCVIDRGDQLRCAGSIGDGPIGWDAEGDRLGSASFDQVKPLPSVVDVATDGMAICAVTADGGLWCWGYDGSEGRLGSAVAVDAPGRVPRLPPVVDVAMYDGLTCARTGKGEVYCFGRNAGGVLGEGVDYAFWPVRAPVSGVDSVQVGPGYACGLAKGRAKCWGEAPRDWPAKLERLETGSGGACAVAGGAVWCAGRMMQRARPDGVPEDEWVRVDGAPVGDLAVGDEFACGSDGRRVACWGEGRDGQLGQVQGGVQGATRVSGLTDAVQLGVGEDSSCARRKKGEVVCWGAGHGALGVEGEVDRSTPVAVDVQAIDLAVTDAAACGLDARGRVICWGTEYDRAWGLGESWSERHPPVAVMEVKGARTVAVGPRAVCASKGREAECTGLFPGDEERRTRSLPGEVALRHRLLCVAGGSGVQCEGAGERGQLGRGIATDQFAPLVPVTGLGAVSDLSVGDDLVCAIEQGAPRCWGHGALVPVRFEAMKATAVSVRDRSACVVADGGVRCFGDAPWVPARAGSWDPLVWSEVPGLPEVVDVGVGDDHACALGRDGTVWCWGEPENGRLGDGGGTYATAPVDIGLGDL